MLTTCGARLTQEGTYFTVWAPKAERVDVIIYQSEDSCEAHSTEHSLSKSEDGVFRTLVAEAKEGVLYKYRVDGKGPFPDPVSRFQPKGVHGPSQVVDFGRFKWKDSEWRGLSNIDKLVVYELHVGTFSEPGSYTGVMEKFRYLKDLGVTALQLMPLADFPGGRNWGYDGVSLYAPARCYGRPEDLCQLVDAAHALGLAVFLDCVYNHLGPDGNYLSCFSPFYFTDKAKTPWGAALNIDPTLDAKHAPHVRRFLIESALCWLRDYHFDGLRLDATHALLDSSSPHFLADLSRACHSSGVPPGKSVYLVAEDDRNLAALLQPDVALDGLWADDFHHQVRVRLTGEQEGYFSDFSGTTEHLAKTIKQGWFFTGQAKRNGEKRGSDPTTVAQLARFSFCIQNHDQIGNRAMGDRLNHAVGIDRYRAASVLVLLAPESPLLFMGQEWGSSSPFAYFTDHTAELGKLVTEGRRKEFAYFKAFADSEQRERIPDPQALSTFTSSKLKWSESVEGSHSELLLLYRTVLHIRNTHPACHYSDRTLSDCIALSADTIALIRRAPASPICMLVIVHFANSETRVAISEQVINSPLMAQRTTPPYVSVLYKTEGAELEEAKPSVAHMRTAGAIVLELK